MSTMTAAAMAEMIGQARFKQAMLAAREHEETEGIDPSLDFQFQYAVATRAAGYDATAQYARILTHEECTLQMRGDTYRDLAMMTFALGNDDDAWTYLARARQAFTGDPNRLASVLMVEARFLIVGGEPELALDLHRQAHRLWLSAGDSATRTWMRTNLFYWLRVLAYLDLGRRTVYLAYKRSGDQRADRARDAALFFWTGPAGAIASLSRETAASWRLQGRAFIEQALIGLDMAYEYV